MTDGNKRTLVLPGEKPLTWNKLYVGKHWSFRYREAKRVHALVRCALDPNLDEFDGPVNISIMVYVKKMLIDADNVSAKLYVDGLKGWWFEDDTKDYIRSVTTQVAKDRDNPRVEITATRIGKPFKYKCSCCDRLWPTKKLLQAHMHSMGNLAPVE